MRRQIDIEVPSDLSVVANNHPSGANCDLSDDLSSYSNSCRLKEYGSASTLSRNYEHSTSSNCAPKTDYTKDTNLNTDRSLDRDMDRSVYQVDCHVNSQISHKSVQNHLDNHFKKYFQNHQPIKENLPYNRHSNSFRMSLFSRPSVAWLFVCLLMISMVRGGERTYVQLVFESEENLSVNTLIGQIRVPDSLASAHTQPPYLFMPVNGQPKACNADADFHIDQHTGDIRNAVRLDRERCSLYKFLAISLKGLSFQITIRVKDVNDERPRFAVPSITIRLPENARPNETRRQLPPATDLDSPQFGLQAYRIKSGNTAEAFALVTHRETDGVLYVDLQVARELDRETVGQYRLIIEALDGGQPPLIAELEVNVELTDVNDERPQFDRSVYSAKVLQNTTIGSRILQVCFFLYFETFKIKNSIKLLIFD